MLKICREQENNMLFTIVLEDISMYYSFTA